MVPVRFISETLGATINWNENNRCYTHIIHSQPTYSYSIQAIDFIVEEIKKEPENIIQTLKDLVSKK